MSRKLVSATVDAFTGEANYDGKTIEARLSGIADMRSTGTLDDLLGKVHSEAIRMAVGEVIVDLRNLEFMNSSCVLKFVTWLSKLEQSPTKYKIRFLCTNRYHWQQRSLHALRAFATDYLSIETR
jgi:hypothetical protein